MKITRSLLLGLSLLGAANAPQTAWAQLPDQTPPQTPKSALDPNAKIALPAQFSAPQFFDALAKATGARIVAPVPDEPQLILLNQRFGGRELTLSQFAQLYGATLDYPLSYSRGEDNLIKVRLPDEMIYPEKPVNQHYVAFLRLLAALSSAQIDQMYLQGGLTAKDLMPTQIPLYLEARRTNAISNFLPSKDKAPTDEQILAQPLRFRFSFQAVALFTDDEDLPALYLFDYGAGLLWNPLVSTDLKPFAEAVRERDAAWVTPVGVTLTTSISSARARATTLDYPQTRVTTVGAVLKEIEAELDQTIVFDGEFYPARVRATPIVISAGRYRADELFDAVGATVGARGLFYNDVPTLKKRAPQQPISQLSPLVEAAQDKLRRFSLQSARLPFFPSRFERRQTLYSELTGSEVLYLKAKLLNENTQGYDEIDLSKHTFRLANQLYFIGQSGGPGQPSVTSSVQLW